MPITPGTFGTLLGWGLYAAGLASLEPWVYLVTIAGLFALGVWACELTGRALGHSDHGAIVWDEVVAFLLVLFFTPGALAWQAAAFVLFRIFDIVKPPPIRYYEQRIKGGLGAMLDDVLAAVYTLIVLAIAKTLLG